jgi:hypothetical protein
LEGEKKIIAFIEYLPVVRKFPDHSDPWEDQEPCLPHRVFSLLTGLPPQDKLTLFHPFHGFAVSLGYLAKKEGLRVNFIVVSINCGSYLEAVDNKIFRRDVGCWRT